MCNPGEKELVASMHIVFLIHKIPVENGLFTNGAGNYVLNMATILNNSGHTVSIVSEDQHEHYIDWGGINIYYVPIGKYFKDDGRPMSKYKKTLKNIVRSFLYNKQVSVITKNTSVDVVQSVSSYGLALLRRKDIPYIVRVSDDPYLWTDANFEKFDFEKSLGYFQLDRQLQLWAEKRADKIIVPSFFMKKLIKHRIGKDSEVIESPVLEYNEKNLVFSEENFEVDSYFLTVSAMNHRKSIRMLSNIIDTLLDEYPTMKYVMVGKDRDLLHEGEYIKVSDYFSSKLSARNRERFLFLGEINDRNRLMSIIKAARLCIYPTRVDNLPNTALESMALGKIIVSTTADYGTSMEELIEDNVNGFLSYVDNEVEMIAKVNQAMSIDSQERKKLRIMQGNELRI